MSEWNTVGIFEDLHPDWLSAGEWCGMELSGVPTSPCDFLDAHLEEEGRVRWRNGFFVRDGMLRCGIWELHVDCLPEKARLEFEIGRRISDLELDGKDIDDELRDIDDDIDEQIHKLHVLIRRRRYLIDQMLGEPK